MPARRILILGGTVEAAQLAASLDADSGFEPITSLAGRTRSPAALRGLVRTGGFGGADGLANYVSTTEIDAVVDATHPFAAQISRNASSACRQIAIPLLRLERPAWRRRPGDNWIEVGDIDGAAQQLAGHGKRVFLSIGRQELGAFGHLTDVWFLLRMIDPPREPLPLVRREMILGRGPFDREAEVQLLSQHRIDTVVSKNSGGDATYGKIAAARSLDLPVIMIRRPSMPEGPSVGTVEAAMDWIAGRAGPAG